MHAAFNRKNGGQYPDGPFPTIGGNRMFLKSLFRVLVWSVILSGVFVAVMFTFFTDTPWWVFPLGGAIIGLGIGRVYPIPHQQTIKK